MARKALLKDTWPLTDLRQTEVLTKFESVLLTECQKFYLVVKTVNTYVMCIQNQIVIVL